MFVLTFEWNLEKQVSFCFSKSPHSPNFWYIFPASIYEFVAIFIDKVFRTFFWTYTRQWRDVVSVNVENQTRLSFIIWKCFILDVNCKLLSLKMQLLPINQEVRWLMLSNCLRKLQERLSRKNHLQTCECSLTLVILSIPPMSPLNFEPEHPILYGRQGAKWQVNCFKK